MKPNAALHRVGVAALGLLTEEDIRADPAGAMTVAMDAMRAALKARQRFTDSVDQDTRGHRPQPGGE